MNKSLLESFIKKYSLNGTIESVKWVAKEKKLNVDTITEDKTVLVKVALQPFEEFADETIGVHETSGLKSMLAVFADDVTLSVEKVKDKVTGMKMVHGPLESSFPSAALDVIPSAPSLKNLPESNCEVVLDEAFVDTFLKLKASLPEVDTFTLLSKKDKTYLVMGYSKLNTKKSSLEIAAKGTVEKPISFSAKFFKEILTANSDCKASNLKVSDKGLAVAEFESDNFKCSYYMVTIKMDE